MSTEIRDIEGFYTLNTTLSEQLSVIKPEARPDFFVNTLRTLNLYKEGFSVDDTELVDPLMQQWETGAINLKLDFEQIYNGQSANSAVEKRLVSAVDAFLPNF